MIYGFGKGVRAMDLDEEEEEEDEPRAKKKTKEAAAPKAPAKNEKAPKVAYRTQDADRLSQMMTRDEPRLNEREARIIAGGDGKRLAAQRGGF